MPASTSTAGSALRLVVAASRPAKRRCGTSVELRVRRGEQPGRVPGDNRTLRCSSVAPAAAVRLTCSKEPAARIYPGTRAPHVAASSTAGFTLSFVSLSAHPTLTICDETRRPCRAQCPIE